MDAVIWLLVFFFSITECIWSLGLCLVWNRCSLKIYFLPFCPQFLFSPISSPCGHHSLPPSFLNFVQKYLWSIYYIPGTVLCMCYFSFMPVLTKRHLSHLPDEKSSSFPSICFLPSVFPSLLGAPWGRRTEQERERESERVSQYASK